MSWEGTYSWFAPPNNSIKKLKKNNNLINNINISQFVAPNNSIIRKI